MYQNRTEIYESTEIPIKCVMKSCKMRTPIPRSAPMY